jgi:hypothetical protein
LPQFPDQARQSLGPDLHPERVFLHVDPLNEELANARLLGGEQLAPDRGEARGQHRYLVPGGFRLVSASRCGRPG